MNTLFDKIWDAHVVQQVEDGPTQLYIDRLYCHEVTSPQAFAGMRARGIQCFRPEKIVCMPDHNTPTHDQDKPIEDPISKTQVDTLAAVFHCSGITCAISRDAMESTMDAIKLATIFRLLILTMMVW